MKVLVRVLLLISLSLVIISCSSKEAELLKKQSEEWREKVNALQEANASLKIENDGLKNKPGIFYMNYAGFDVKKRFIAQTLDLYALPQKGFMKVNTIQPNTAVDVIDAVTGDEGEIWIHVIMPVYDTPANNKGWILESDTLILTKENKKMVLGDVGVKAGAVIYDVLDFGEIQSTQPTEAKGDHRRCWIDAKQNGYARLMCGGGEDFWVSEEDILYPLTDEEELAKARSKLDFSIGSKPQSITVYFVDWAHVTSERFLQPIEILIPQESDPAVSAVSLLMKDFSNLKLSSGITNNTGLQSVQKKDDLYIVSFDSNFLENGYYTTESVIECLVYTLTDLPGIRGVQIVIDSDSEAIPDGLTDKVHTREGMNFYAINERISYTDQ